MMNAQEYVERFRKLCLVRGVDVLERGHIRVETGFLYPDGSSVDVFLTNDRPLFPPTVLSDLGQTTDFLVHHGVKYWNSRKRRSQLETDLSLYGVKLDGGALTLQLEDLNAETLEAAVLMLGQACVRMSDLVLTRRLQVQSVFSEDVEEFLNDVEIPYEPGVVLEGAYGPVQLDFLVQGKKTRSAVLALTSRYSGASHAAANEVFRKFHDLMVAGLPEQRITLLDDSEDPSSIYRPEDLRRIEAHSSLVPFSAKEDLRSRLAA